MMKIIEAEKCDAHTALAWAVSAKNNLSNQSGYSPNELIFGFNTNMGSVLSDKLPALYPTSESDVVRMNINARHTARKGHIEAEASDKIRKALRSKVRVYSDEEYLSGEKVYYRRQNTKGWKGPGVVLGSEGNFVLIRHGGAFYRVHPCQLMKVTKTVYGEKSKSNTSNCEQSKSNNIENKNSKVVISSCEEINTEEQHANIDEINVGEQNNEEMENVENEMKRPTRGTRIKYKLFEENDWRTGMVMNKQPKITGQYRNWVNIAEDNEEEQSINFEYVENWEEVTGKENEELEGENIVLYNSSQETLNEVIEAKNKELKNMKDNDVYELVPYTGQKTISAKWIFSEKIKNGKKVIKARIVAKGFEENTSNLKTDSPTCSRESLRLVMLTASTMNWQLQSIDFTCAFLQGDRLEREVYLKMPEDICSSDEV